MISKEVDRKRERSRCSTWGVQVNSANCGKLLLQKHTLWPSAVCTTGMSQGRIVTWKDHPGGKGHRVDQLQKSAEGVIPDLMANTPVVIRLSKLILSWVLGESWGPEVEEQPKRVSHSVCNSLQCIAKRKWLTFAKKPVNVGICGFPRLHHFTAIQTQIIDSTLLCILLLAT